MSKKPYLHFFPSDWMGDPKLRACKPATRGIWIDLICLMHDAEPYGHLTIGGVNPWVKPPKTLQRAIGVGYATLIATLNDLVNAGVCGVTNDGVIYSRKMVRSFEKSKKGQIDGKLGGNPALKKGLTPVVNPSGYPPLPESISNKKEREEVAANAAPVAEQSLADKSGAVVPFPSSSADPLSLSPERYAVEEGRLRITHADFAKLEKSFSDISVPSAVMALSDWAGKQPNPYMALRGALDKRNQLARMTKEIEAKKAIGQPKRRHID